MNKVSIILIIMLIICGCNKSYIESKEELKYYSSENGRVIFFIYDAPYIYDSTYSRVRIEINNNKLTIDGFLSELSEIDTLRDGGSKVYYYNKEKEVFGNLDFYVISCNTIDGVDDVYVTKDKESISTRCVKREIIKEELIELENNIFEKSDRLKYRNIAAISINDNRLIIELVNNSSEEQQWFRENIANSKYIIFKQGGPYRTSLIGDFYPQGYKELTIDYNIKDAIINNDVIISDDYITNPDNLESFIENFNKKELSFIRIVKKESNDKIIVFDIKTDGEKALIVILKNGKIEITKYNHIEDIIDLDNDPAIERLIAYNDENDKIVIYEIYRIIN